MGGVMNKEGKTHRVLEGENFSSIAKKYGISLQDLQLLNQTAGKTKYLNAYPQRAPAWGVESGDLIYLPDTKKDNDSKPTKVDDKNIGSKQGCPKCNFYTVSVQCEGTGRNFIYKLPDKSKNPGPFQIICGGDDHPEKYHDTLRFSYSADKCKNGLSPSVCPVLKTTNNHILVNGSSLKMTVQKVKSITFDSFFNNYLVPSSKGSVISISTDSCINDFPKIEIEAFPYTKWKGSVSVGYFHDTYKNTYKKIRQQGYWGLEGEIDVQCGEYKQKIGAKIAGEVDSDNVITKKIFTEVQGVLNKITPLLSEVRNSYGSIQIEWPKLKLSGDICNVEHKNSRLVGTKGNVSISMDPLIGANFEVDILNILINTAGTLFGPPGVAISKSLIKLKELGKNSIKDGRDGVNIQILFKAIGTINGEVKWSLDENGNCKCSGSVEGKLELIFSAKAEFELDCFIFNAGAGASADAKCAFSQKITPKFDKNKAPYIGCDIEGTFNGLTVHTFVYIRASLYKNEGGKPDQKGEWTDLDGVENKYVLIEECKIFSLGF
jgi:hypothetical protein